MGNVLTYSYIILRTWSENYNPDKLINIIGDQLSSYTIEDQNFHSPIITIAGVATVFHILNHLLCWWFMILGDQMPTSDYNYFSDNCINLGNWINLDNDDDDDIIILDDNDANDNENYRNDQEEAVRLQAVRDRQIYLLRLMRSGPQNKNDDEETELDPLFEENHDDDIPTV